MPSLDRDYRILRKKTIESMVTAAKALKLNDTISEQSLYEIAEAMLDAIDFREE